MKKALIILAALLILFVQIPAFLNWSKEEKAKNAENSEKVEEVDCTTLPTYRERAICAYDRDCHRGLSGVDCPIARQALKTWAHDPESVDVVSWQGMENRYSSHWDANPELRPDGFVESYSIEVIFRAKNKLGAKVKSSKTLSCSIAEPSRCEVGLGRELR